MENDFVPDFQGRRILLVEDIDINRMILKELLSDTHVEIEEAVDGLDGVNKYASSEPGYYDFIFMDVQMPNMDGYEASRKIRELERGRGTGARVPIFAMTANAYREDIEKAIEAGMNGHLAKPVEIKAVMRVLAQYLGKNEAP